MKTRDPDNDAFLIGFATGLRSATPIAAVARAVTAGEIALPPPFANLARPRVATAMTVASLGELVVDKLPFTPSRLERRGLIFRSVAGAASGACVAAAQGRPAWRGALPGLLGALAGSFAGYRARTFLTHVALQAGERHRWPPAATQVGVAVAEDAASVGLSLWVLRRCPKPEARFNTLLGKM
jgi:uncharacterized membrane protein